MMWFCLNALLDYLMLTSLSLNPKVPIKKFPIVWSYDIWKGNVYAFEHTVGIFHPLSCASVVSRHVSFMSPAILVFLECPKKKKKSQALKIKLCCQYVSEVTNTSDK